MHDMDLDQQIQMEHLMLLERDCRVCGKKKILLDDFYRCRKDPTKLSSYSYECKECTKSRVASNCKIGTCVICGTKDARLTGDICKHCNRGLTEFGNNVDMLRKAVLYLEQR